MFEADDPTTIRGEVRKRLKDEMLRVVMAALDLGAPARLTRNGIIIASDQGTVGTHWTVSDWRASRNLEAQLRRIGYDLPRTQTKGSGNGTSRAKKPGPQQQQYKALPAPYEAPRPQTLTYRHTIPGEPEPEPTYKQHRPPRQDAGTRARGLQTRKVDPRLAAAFPRLSDDLRDADPDLVMAALVRADGDPRRVTVEPDGSLMVWNVPAW